MKISSGNLNNLLKLISNTRTILNYLKINFYHFKMIQAHKIKKKINSKNLSLNRIKMLLIFTIKTNKNKHRSYKEDRSINFKFKVIKSSYYFKNLSWKIEVFCKEKIRNNLINLNNKIL